MKRTLTFLFAWGLLAAGFISSVVQVTAATAFPAELTGSYEAQLVVPTALTVPVGKIEFAVSNAGKAVGKVYLPNGKSYPFNATLAADTGSAFVNLFVIVKGKFPAGPQPLQMNLRVYTDGSITGATQSTLAGVPAVLNMVEGIRQVAYTGKTGQEAPWKGSYTLAASATDPSEGDPTGSCVASLVVDAKGTMTVAGKLADGTPLTGSFKPSADGVYRIYSSPYVNGGYFSVVVAFSQIGTTGKYHVADGANADAVWQKNANTKDKLFKDGFGPIALTLSVEPWVEPAKGQTLVSSFTLDGKQFPLDLLGSTELAKVYPGKVPSRVTLTTANKLVPVFGDELAPKTEAAWGKIFSLTVTPKTGRFSGSLKVSDFVTKPASGSGNNTRYEAAKVMVRTLSIEGVLVRQAEGADTPFVLEGYFVADPLGGDDGLTGGVAGGDTLETVGTGAPAADAIPSGTPGTYQFTVKTEVTIDSSDIPFGDTGFSLISQESAPAALVNGSTQTFTIAPDVTFMTFNGRKLPLAADGRIRGVTTGGALAGGSLVYADTTKPGAKAPKKDNMIVVLYLNGDGTVSGVLINNVFVLPAKYRIFIPAQTITVTNPVTHKVTTTTIPAINRTVTAFTFALNAYSDLTDPVKIPTP